MSHILDRPIWSALDSRHAELSEGGPLARRYKRGITPFAAARDNAPECLEALAGLAEADEALVIVEPNGLTLPRGLVTDSVTPLVQMVASRPPENVGDARIERLGPDDAEEMMALAMLTKPGPFSLKAQCLGEFWGIRENGMLIAMAGERMKQEGFTELSGVCTHPDARGRGLGRLMSLFAARRIFDRGEVPYLHAYASNETAIGLYESIGFTLRRMLTVSLIKRQA